MADTEGREENQLARKYRRNTKRLRRKLLDRYLMAMKEDLVEWLSTSMDIEDLNALNFMSKLDNGVLLCQHAKILQHHAESYAATRKPDETVKIPKRNVVFRKNGAFQGSFIARDNVSNFIDWCRDLGIPNVVLFETEDLVLHKNEKTVILTLLELARKGAMFGMKPPRIIELEEEIEREIAAEKEKQLVNQETVAVEESLILRKENSALEKENTPLTKEISTLVEGSIELETGSPTVKHEQETQTFRKGRFKPEKVKRVYQRETPMFEKEYDLDELVQEVVDSCTCASPFPVKKLGEGKYMFGKSKQVIYVRVMRNHVMVRVGGGWDTLEHFIQKHDLCRMRLGGYVDHRGDAQKLPSHTLSSVMDGSSDGMSVASSGSFFSLDDIPLLCLSPDQEDGKPYCSCGPSVSRQSSVSDASGDEFNFVRASKSEPISFGKPKRGEAKDSLYQSKSETFTKFGSHQLSLLSDNLTDSDVYATRNPSDSWLRKHLSNQKLASKTVEGSNLPKEEPLANGKENEAKENEKLTVDGIKKKYGKPVKSKRVARKESDASSTTHKRTQTSPGSKTVSGHGENVPKMQSRNYPQYRSWDQSLSVPKKRSDGVQEMKKRSDFMPKENSKSRDTLSVSSKLDVRAQQRPSFYKGYTVDSGLLKASGIRRRGEETPLQSSDIRRETSADSIVKRRSKLPLPTFWKSGSRSFATAKGSSSHSMSGCNSRKG